MTQLALAHAPAELFVDQLNEPYLYHDISRPGFTAFFTTRGPWRQRSYKLPQLPEQLNRMRSFETDIYIAQNEFFRPNRQVVCCWRMTSLYVDLDTYKLEHLYGQPAEALTELLLRSCDEQGIPPPSVVVYSGRGLQAKWVLETPVPARALVRWTLLQGCLLDCLSHLGSDPQAQDASRVLRLVGTVNSKSGEVVRVTHVSRVPTSGGVVGPAGVVVYDFDTFSDTVLPVSRNELVRRRAEHAELQQLEVVKEDLAARRRQAVRDNLVVISGAVKSVNRSTAQRIVPSQLAWDRLADLRRLVELRGFDGGAPPGDRNAFVFLASCFLATAMVAANFKAEVHELAREFAPMWGPAEVNQCVSAVCKRVDAAAQGEKVQFRGYEVDPRYRFTNQRLVEWLAITGDEMVQMRTIVSQEEARRRDRLRKESQRRAHGSLARESYLLLAREKAAQARALRETGLSLSSIADELGISRASACAYCRG